jgi:phage FluMu gp28-like protein
MGKQNSKNESGPAEPAPGEEKRIASATAPVARGSQSESPVMGESATYFYESQRKWILDEAMLQICEKGRQEGFSYAHSYKVVRRISTKKAKDEWVVSRDEFQAKQFILYCKRWAKVLNYAAEDLGEQVLMTDGGKSVQVQVLKFASGACIYALSSNPDAIIGKTGHVTLDEFAAHKEQRLLYALAKPVTQWGGTLAIISTHRGVGTVFNQIITDIKERGNKMGWSLHTVPIQKAVAEGLVEKINQVSGRKETRAAWLERMRAECIDEEQWLQEYCCIPADESTAFITYEMIGAVEETASPLRDFGYLAQLDPRTSQLYLGMDVARKTDLCVIDVGEKLGDVMWDRVRIELKGKKFGEIEEELYRLLRLPAMRRGCIDATGLGMQLAERAQERFGWKAEPVTFTAPVKEELAFGLRGDFEDRKLRLPHDEKLRADLRGIKKEVTAAGNIRFVGDSEDSHCDRFWAKALRQHAARSKGGQFFSALI